MEKTSSDFNAQSLVIGCVTENTPKYLSQALRLVQSVRWFGGKIAEAKFIICAVKGLDPAYKDEFERYTATVRIVENFSEKHPQSNKLRFLQQSDLKDYENVLLLDCDTIVVQDPSSYLLSEGFRAKIADGATVPHEIFEKLYNFFHLPLPGKDHHCTVTGTPTIPYFNAGVLKFSQPMLNSLVPAWIALNEELLEHLDLLDRYAKFCEQASLSLAVTASGTQFDKFGDEMNFPVHYKEHTPSLEKIDPLIIHYHWLVDPSGYIKPSIYPLVDNRIAQFNQRLREERERHFDNRSFWNYRYSESHELGSGHGSRGAARDYKRKLLTDLTNSNQFRTILDIGCGDMEVSSALPAEGYVGVDISNVVVDRNREIYLDRTFICGDFLDLDLSPADLVVCTDVLIHIDDSDYYKRFVSRLVEKTIKVGLIAGYEADPGYRGIVFFHEPLSKTLKRAGVKKLCKLGSYRDTDIWLFSKGNSRFELFGRILSTLSVKISKLIIKKSEA